MGNLPAVIKKIRERKGLTQAAFGALLSVRQTTVSKWECGTAKPEASSLMSLFYLAEHKEEADPIMTALSAVGVSVNDIPLTSKATPPAENHAGC